MPKDIESHLRKVAQKKFSEIVNRIKLWRYLTGDSEFDIDGWLTRMKTPRPG